MKPFGHLILAIILVVQIDGCINRDVHIELPKQYRLVAISARSPIELSYSHTSNDGECDTWASREVDFRNGNIKYYLLGSIQLVNVRKSQRGDTARTEAKSSSILEMT